MKRFMFGVVAAALFASCGFAQSCGLVSDEAGIISGNIQPDALVNQGADVHVVTVASIAKYGVRLADVEKSYEQHCPAWLAANGHRKANLMVFIVAPSDRKKNAFFGDAYTGAFPDEDTVNSIYSQAANPYFKNKQFAEGVNAAIKDFAGKVAAYHDQQKHPVQSTTTVTEQATDYSGLWTVLKWGLLFVVIGGGIFGVVFFLSRRGEVQEQLRAAQRDAINVQGLAAAAFMRLDKAKDNYTSLAQRYQDLSNSVSHDPNQTGLSVDDYVAIGNTWRNFMDDMDGSPRRTVRTEHQASVHAASTFRSRPVDSAPSSPASAPQTVVVNNSSNDNGLLTGMIIGEELERPERVVEEPSYSRPEPSSSSSDSGSDSSWGSSSSDSGSSGSDSSWSDSSSSSDSGGGGSDSSW